MARGVFLFYDLIVSEDVVLTAQLGPTSSFLIVFYLTLTWPFMSMGKRQTQRPNRFWDCWQLLFIEYVYKSYVTAVFTTTSPVFDESLLAGMFGWVV